MASSTLSRTLFRAAIRSAHPNPAAPGARQSLAHVRFPRAKNGWYGRRQYSFTSTGAATGAGLAKPLILSVVAGTLAGASYYLYATDQLPALRKAPAPPLSTKDKYQQVYDEIARLLVEHDDYDDGSYGPVILRLAWHASGTYDKETKTGGSNGATMRFAPESGHSANAGLKAARDFLEPVKQKFPWITYSDLWILGGVCAIQELGGPNVSYRPGRQDGEAAACTPDGRLPDASKEQKHLRGIFNRMGFNDQEIVALSGAHALGRCHTDRSGYENPWTFSPTVLTNDFYKLLVDEKWQWRKWSGPAQYEDTKTKTLMMLPTDMALVKDKEFAKHVARYAKDQDVFFADFSKVMEKLFELGVPFKDDQEKFYLTRTS